MNYHAVFTTMQEAVETAATLGTKLGKELFAFADPQRGATFIVADEPPKLNAIEDAETPCPTRSAKSGKRGVCKTKSPPKGVVAIRSVVEGIRELQGEKQTFGTLPPAKRRAVRRSVDSQRAKRVA